MNKPHARGKSRRFAFLFMVCGLAVAAASFAVQISHSQTAQGEIEGRPSPTFRRICLGGGNAGHNCKQNSECPGSTCRDRNVFNITVAVLYNAPAGDITAIEDMITGLSAVLLDVTDGQAEIGEAFIYNNAFGTTADLRIYPSTAPTWWQADTGNYKVGGSIHVSIDNVMGAAFPGESLALSPCYF